MGEHEYKITYKDGSTQLVTAAYHQADKDWVVFMGTDIMRLRVHGDEIESIAAANVPDRVRREIVIG
jgi:hypothetical protein